jgi:hypothetical protein
VKNLPAAPFPGARRWWLPAAGVVLAASLCGSPGPAGQDPPDTLLLTLAPLPVTPAGDSPAPGPRIAIIHPRGGEPRLLTGGFSEARSPSASFDGRSFLFRGRQGPRDAASIWRMGIDGTGARRVTSGNGDPDDPVFLPDDRVLYSDRLPAGGASDPRVRALFTCAAEGSDTRRVTFGWQIDARPEVLPDGLVRFARRPLDADPFQPPSFMTVRPDGTGYARWSGDPCDCDGEGPGEAPAGDPGVEVLRTDNASPRDRPPVHAGLVRDDLRTGVLICRSVYAPHLPGAAVLPAGSVRRVRVAEQGPPGTGGTVMNGTPAATARASGPGPFVAVAPVAPDGSFLIEVPADTPLGLDLLDDDGRSIARSPRGLWVRPGESRGCAGCHADLPLAPESDGAPPMAGGDPTRDPAARREGVPIAAEGER